MSQQEILNAYIQAVYEQKWATVDYMYNHLDPISSDWIMIPEFSRERYQTQGEIVV